MYAYADAFQLSNPRSSRSVIACSTIVSKGAGATPALILALAVAAEPCDTIWQIWKIFDELENPSTNLKITNELYAYPFVEVCFYHGEGCGFENESTDVCVASALAEGSSTVHFGNNSFYDFAKETQYSNCVGFDLGSLEFGDDITAEDDEVIISMFWIATDIASTETDYYDRISVLLSEEEPTDDTLQSLVELPYNRVEPGVGPIILQESELIIGKTTNKILSGDVTTNFAALVVSTSEYTTENFITSSSDDDTQDIAFGELLFYIKQGSYSRTAIAEVDPLDIGTFLGNIGGFWVNVDFSEVEVIDRATCLGFGAFDIVLLHQELLLILWGLFFIATREERGPNMKARDFARAVRTTKHMVTRRRSAPIAAPASTNSNVEEPPQWESAFQGDNTAAPQFGARNTADPTAPPVNDGDASAATRRASSTSSRSGSTSSANYGRATSGLSDPHGDSSSSNVRGSAVRDMPTRGSRSGGSLA